MEMLLTVFFFFALMFSAGIAHEAKDFDDSILYKIEFELPADLNEPDFATKNLVPKFYTHDKEEYQCAIPIAEETREEKTLDYTGLSPLELIQPMFSSVSCSYRIEAYWSYEICHGFYIKQYHEEREGKNVKYQEYYLGRWNDERQEKLVQKLAADRKEGVKFKTTKIDNVHYPYLELEMGNGTFCDLSNERRTTRIRYVCYPHGKNAIYSFKETSTCNYEAIILSSMLCIHPAFLPEESKEIPIKCYNSPTLARKPLSMLKQTLEDLEMTEMYNKVDIFGNDRRFSMDSQNVEYLQKILEVIAAPPPLPFLNEDNSAGTATVVWGDENNKLPKDSWDYIRAHEDLKHLYDFLFKKCLIGGTGWWKYEFCFGRHVRQFHKDKKSETELFLGYFKDSVHRDWLKSHPAKRLKRKPADSDTTIWHHYEQGSRCDKTGKPREVDVKLMCVLSPSVSSLSMYLLEPKTCQYIMVVESPLVCAVLPMVDEDGLISEADFKKYVSSMLGESGESIVEKVTTSESEEPSPVVVDDIPL